MSKKFEYQKRMGKVLNNHIPEKTLLKRNKEKSWQYGYNKEFEVVIASKNGTISQPYVLHNLKICTPAIPDEKDILGHKLEKEKQRWKRIEVPEDLKTIEAEAAQWNRNSANKNNYKTATDIFYLKPKGFIVRGEKFIATDYDRRKYGVWQYINGKPIWIPPSHYFFLEHIPVYASIYPDFRFSNLDYYLFWEATLADKRSLGFIFVKGRRSGASTMAGSEGLNIATSSAESLLAHMNINSTDAMDYMKDMVIRPFKKLPFWIKPAVSSATNQLEFKGIAHRTSAKTTTILEESGLDTVFKTYPTKINSMDGRKVKFMHLDEYSKLPTDTPAESCWAIKARCLTVGFNVIGKAMVTSTVNPMNKGGLGFKNIYNASDVTKRLSTGKTASGLYSFFIPAQWAMEGGYDQYGYSVVHTFTRAIKNEQGELIHIGNYERIKEEAQALKKTSPILYNEHIRQFPTTELEAFRDSAEESIFNAAKINDQMDYNEMLLTNAIKQESSQYEKGNFINKSKIEGSYEIEWIPSKNGRFWVSWMPKPELRNNFKDVGGYLTPMNDFGVFGVDPYKFSKTVDPRGSKGACSLVTGNSLNVSEIPDNECVLEYLHRPATIDIYIKDMVYAMLFYGVEGLIESNVPNLLEYMKRNNLTKFAMRRKDVRKISPEHKALGGIPMTSEQVLQSHYFAIQDYVEKYIGEDDEGKYRDKGQMGNMPFNRTLKQLLNFSPEHRTENDLGISFGLSVMGNKMKHLIPKRTFETEVSRALFKEYDYSNSNWGV